MLPEHLNPSDETAVSDYMRLMLAPHEPEQDGCFPFAFYSIVYKEWYSSFRDLEVDYPQAIKDSELVIVPVHTLLCENRPHAFITLDGEWHESGSTYRKIDEDWPLRFHGLAEPYKDHLSVAIYFKC